MSYKPTLGHPSRTSAVLALRADGKTTREIGETIGIADSAVTALEHSYRRTRRRSEGNRTVLLPVEVLDALYGDAVKRSLTVNALIRLIVETVADEKMVDSILDDA